MANGEDTAHHPNRKVSREDRRMQAREDSYGESGEYAALSKQVAEGYPEPENIFSSPRNPRVRQAISDEILRRGHTSDERTAYNQAASVMKWHRKGPSGLTKYENYGGYEGIPDFINTAISNRKK